MKSAIWISFLFLLCLTFAFSQATEYAATGGSGALFQNDAGIWRNTLDYSVSGLISVTNQTGMPLMADMDNDGTNELVLLDGHNFKILRGSNFSGAVASYIDANLSDISPMFVLFDIDGDGTKEIVAASNLGKISILSFNGTAINKENTLSLTASGGFSSNFNAGETAGNSIPIIGCRAVDDCFVAYMKSTYWGTTYNTLYGIFFSSTVVGAQTNLTTFETGASSSDLCFPNMRTITVDDYDLDGTVEYIFSGTQSGSNNDRVNVFYVGGTSTPVLEHLAYNSAASWGGSQTTDCFGIYNQANAFKYVTNAAVSDFDNDGMKEVAVGSMTSSSKFRLFLFDTDGSLIRQYPTLFTADGVIVSNIAVGDVFESGQPKDFCVLGYNSNNKLDLLCASETTQFSFLGFPTVHSQEFIYDLNDLGLSYIPVKWNVWDNMIHFSYQGFSDGVIDLVSSYGLFSVDFGRVNVLAYGLNNSLALNFQNPHQNSTVVMLDVENVGYSDMLILTSNNLWYLNDRFVNSPAVITDVSTNPCITNIWLQNTSVQVRVKIEDIDSDAVAARAILYNNATDPSWIQDSGWSENVSSGTTLNFAFVANHTAPTGYLEVFGRDVVNPLDEDKTSLLFTVSPTVGQVYGDSDCSAYSASVTPVAPSNETGNLNFFNQQNNTIKNGIDNLFRNSGLSYSIIWLIAMGVVAFTILEWASLHKYSIVGVSAITILVEFIMIILGTALGFLSVWIIITLVIGSIIALAIWLATYLHGQNQAG